MGMLSVKRLYVTGLMTNLLNLWERSTPSSLFPQSGTGQTEHKYLTGTLMHGIGSGHLAPGA